MENPKGLTDFGIEALSYYKITLNKNEKLSWDFFYAKTYLAKLYIPKIGVCNYPEMLVKGLSHTPILRSVWFYKLSKVSN